MKRIILMTGLSIFLSCSFVFAATPVIFYSDLESGPKTGGRNNKGAYVTVFGKNFGATQGTGVVNICGGQAYNYPVWSDTKISFQLGDNQPNPPNTGVINVVTSDGTSNDIPFTIRAGDIYFISLTGSDTTGTGSFSNPWRNWKKIRTDGSPGCITYIRGGTYNVIDGHDNGLLLYISPSYLWEQGASVDGAPRCFIGYPGETVTYVAGGTDPGGVYGFPMNYITAADQIPLHSNLVIANMIFDCNYMRAGIGWRGYSNAASPSSHVKNIRYVNLEVKNYKKPASEPGGGASIIGCGASGPLDNVKVLGCSCHDVVSNDSLDHIIYHSAGGVGYEIGWCTFYNLSSDVPASTFPGYLLQFHAGLTDATLTTFSNVVVHDNIFHTSTGRGGVNFADGVIDAQFYNNIIYDITGTNLYNDGQGHGSTFARFQSNHNSGSGTFYSYNNVIYASAGTTCPSLIDISNLNKVYFRNNIVVSALGVIYQNSGGGAITIESSNNLWYGNGAPPSWATGQLNSDPLLINPPVDFHLQVNPGDPTDSLSPCHDSGSALVSSVVSKDFDGLSRPWPLGGAYDIGPYEFSSGSSGGTTGGGGGGGGCYIATASYGTPLAAEVLSLSKFRDSYLLTNPTGRQFVKFYWKVSPSIARYIAKREWAKSIVRATLRPVVWGANMIMRE